MTTPGRTHVDLFSGIGGFTLAADWNSVRTVCFVEKDERCRAFLGKAWPEATQYDDIKTFDGRPYAGAWLLTGGVPCQPVSCAGKQRGAKDDRWLWPEALRVLAEVRPAWAIFENPAGLGNLGLDGILAQVGSEGYAVRVYGIPACAVDSPQRRMRYWIVCRHLANSNEKGQFKRRPESRTGICKRDGKNQSDENEKSTGEYLAHRNETGCRTQSASKFSNIGEKRAAIERSIVCLDLGNAEECREWPRLCEDGTWKTPRRFYGVESANSSQWSRFVWLPCADGKLRRVPDDSFGVVDGLHRSVLGALGNSIVPQIAERLIAAMIQSEEEEDHARI